MQIVQNPVDDVFWPLCAFSGSLEVARKIEVIRQYARVIGAHLILLHETSALRLRQFRNPRPHIGEQHFALYGNEIGVGKIAIIVGELFCAHEKRFPGDIVPAPSFLFESSAVLQHLGLALNFVSKRAPDPTDRVNVFYLDFNSKLRLRCRADGNIAVAPKLSFLHVSIAHRSVDQNLFERR